jgi:predicted DNA-binding ArsR family transcriptional regulator
MQQNTGTPKQKYHLYMYVYINNVSFNFKCIFINLKKIHNNADIISNKMV